MSAEELLARDRYAATFGVRLVSAADDRVVVEADLIDGRPVNPGLIFSLADCAMSLISNASARAVAIATHITFVDVDVSDASRLRAEIIPVSPTDHRSVTWHATVTTDKAAVATFTGTTLRVG